MTPHPSVRPLDDLVIYTESSVVSRMLLKQKGGTVTVFAFAAGEGLSEHTAPSDALTFVFDGSARITVGGRSFEVGTGETIILPAHVPHALHAEQPFKMLLVMLRA